MSTSKQQDPARPAPAELDRIFSAALRLHQQGRLQDARNLYLQILQSQPGDADALHFLGVVEGQSGNFQAAAKLISESLRINPNNASACGNLGNALKEIKQLDAAVTWYDRAIALQPEFAEACYNRGNALKELRRYAAAIASYDQVIRIRPDYAYVHGDRLHNKMFICDWNGFEHELGELSAKISAGRKASTPFPLLALLDSLPLQQQAARIYVEDKYPVNPSLGGPVPRPDRQKIRLAYYSADFHNHATAYLMAELFEKHDRTRFELFGFSFGPAMQDRMRDRLSAAFDHFLDVRDRSDLAVAKMSRDAGIDIAVDLKGFTIDNRAGIFACRAAPVQVSYLGYPGTMASRFIDYLVADRMLIPEQSRPYYSEKIAYLPFSYQVNDSKRQIAARQYAREELGLPREGFVFCCFNNTYKITPAVFDCWMRILQRIEDSVLWLFEGSPAAAVNLRQQAARRGVDAQRLIFAGRMPAAEHLARHRAADLFLDTLPYNAHTTASDALWAGLPLLTCTGESFASRVAASLLRAVDLPELITHDLKEYEALAIELASEPERLHAIRRKLEQQRSTAPLFDIARFTRHIENAYTQMIERHDAGLSPDHILVRTGLHSG